jgi:NADH-quinone oxidoreductase subunit G/NADP-reducing hydrogenase subunit HndD
MKTFFIKINNKKVKAKENETILDVANRASIRIPTLCYHPELKPNGVCRICLVEEKETKKLIPSCVTKVKKGMEIFTDTEKVKRVRKTNLELLMKDHAGRCKTCKRNGNCELQDLAKEYDIDEFRFVNDVAGIFKNPTISEYDLDKYIGKQIIDDKSPALTFNQSLCINCGRCVDVCQNKQQVGILYPNSRGIQAKISPAFEKSIADSICTNCGQCALRCPVAGIYEDIHIDEVEKALANPKKTVIVQTAPSIRVSLGEEFNAKENLITGKMVAALRKLGFDKIFGTDLGADFTTIEEAYELLERIKNPKSIFPMFTSCCPAWVKFVEDYFPELVPNLSTTKEKIKPDNLIVVAIMPCTAKKFEITRKNLENTLFGKNKRAVDYVLTTREAVQMIKKAKIDFKNLPDEKFDNPLGISSGAGAIYGITGEVMESVLRTAVEIGNEVSFMGRFEPSLKPEINYLKGQSEGFNLPDSKIKKLEFKEVRGTEGIREAKIKLNGKKIKVAIVHGLDNAKKICRLVLEKKADYHFIEVMACPGGCIGGGGQPIKTNEEIRIKRIKALYAQDKKMPVRRAHKNPALQKIYKEFLGKPLIKKSHQLLHTNYK